MTEELLTDGFNNKRLEGGKIFEGIDSLGVLLEPLKDIQGLQKSKEVLLKRFPILLNKILTEHTIIIELIDF